MAQGRMLRKAISTSESIEAMSEFAQLEFDRIVIHTDDFGRIEGSPAKLKAITKPLSPRPPGEFAAAVAEMIQGGAIEAYTIDKKVYLHIREFERHQRGLNHRTASEHPAPETGQGLTADQYLSSAGAHSLLNSQEFFSNRSEQNRTEQKGTKKATPAAQPPDFDVLKSFTEAWTECLSTRVPKPVHKTAAKRSYLRSVKSVAAAEKCRQARRNYAGSERVRKGFVQDASTWFGDWESWVGAIPPPQRGPDGLAVTDGGAETRRVDRIRESLPLDRTRPDVAEYLDWAYPRGRAGGLRSDAVPFDEWRAAAGATA